MGRASDRPTPHIAIAVLAFIQIDAKKPVSDNLWAN
jgi:hypothetical protein